jgi:hypothetical protein
VTTDTPHQGFGAVSLHDQLLWTRIASPISQLIVVNCTRSQIETPYTIQLQFVLLSAHIPQGITSMAAIEAAGDAEDLRSRAEEYLQRGMLEQAQHAATAALQRTQDTAALGRGYSVLIQADFQFER